MGKGARNFLYACAFALLIYYQFTKDTSSSPAAQANEFSMRAVHKGSLQVGAVKKRELRLPSIHSANDDGPAVHPALGALNSAHDLIRKARMRFSLTVTEIESLESSWGELRQVAQAEAVPDGWLLTHVEPDSLLARVGFQESDMILKQELEDRYQDQDPEVLERLERILNYIAR